MWDRLRMGLTRFVVRLVHHAQVAEDIAAEIVLCAWRRFRLVANWQDVWSWSLAAARRSVAKFFRSKRRSMVTLNGQLDMLAAAPSWTKAVEAADFVDVLSLHLGTAEGETLRALAAGVATNAEIAAVRRVSIRAVQVSRNRLRRFAEGMELLP